MVGLTENLVPSSLIIFWLAWPKMKVRQTKILNRLNQIAILLFEPPQKVASAYKIYMSIRYKASSCLVVEPMIKNKLSKHVLNQKLAKSVVKRVILNNFS